MFSTFLPITREHTGPTAQAQTSALTWPSFDSRPPA